MGMATALACAAPAGSLAAAAATEPVINTPSRYQIVQEAPAGWAWYFDRRAVRPVGNPVHRMYEFWMTGDNRGAGRVQAAMAQLLISCNYQSYVQRRVTLFDDARVIVSTVSKGSDPSNWVALEPAGPTAAARAWICRQGA